MTLARQQVRSLASSQGQVPSRPAPGIGRGKFRAARAKERDLGFGPRQCGCAVVGLRSPCGCHSRSSIDPRAACSRWYPSSASATPTSSARPTACPRGSATATAPVQRHDRRRHDGDQPVVEPDDRRPVGLLVAPRGAVQRLDRRCRWNGPSRWRRMQASTVLPLGDRGGIPERAVLVHKQHNVSAAAAAAAGIRAARI